MAIKAFGIALKLTLAGDNQFSHPSTYVFLIITVVCILTQMNYFNKALSQFSTNIVNPLYYVTFTTFTLCASFILFQGFNTTNPVNTISLLCGFLVIFSGVYLLNLSRKDPDGRQTHLPLNSSSDDLGDGSRDLEDEDMMRRLSMHAVPTDGIAGLQTRRSMQSRRSGELARLSNGNLSGGRQSVSRGRLMHGYEDYDERDAEIRGAGAGADGERYTLGELSDMESDDGNGGKKSRNGGVGNGRTVR